MTKVFRTGRARPASFAVALAGALAVAALLLVPLGSSGAVPTVNHAFASYDTGRVRVSLATAQPTVTLTEDSDSAVSALLSTVAVVELVPVANGYDVAASAVPTPQTAFNGSRPASATSGWSVSLAADLGVRSASGPFWNGSASGPTPAAGATFGISELRIGFAPGPNTTAGASLLVTWSVANWPFVATGDYLGVEFTLQTANAPILESCRSATSLAAPGCTGTGLATRAGTWNAGTTGVEADNTSGAVAALAWAPSATNGSSAPAVSGARADPSGGIDVVVAEPSTAGPASGTVAFALYAPTSLPNLGPQVAGSGPYYLITASIAAGAALGGLALYRARDERIADEL